MTVTMAPGASSDCTKAYLIAIDAPTTSPSHGDTSSVHGESPRVIPEKRYVLAHPRLHLPGGARSAGGEPGAEPGPLALPGARRGANSTISATALGRWSLRVGVATSDARPPASATSELVLL